MRAIRDLQRTCIALCIGVMALAATQVVSGDPPSYHAKYPPFAAYQGSPWGKVTENSASPLWSNTNIAVSPFGSQSSGKLYASQSTDGGNGYGSSLGTQAGLWIPLGYITGGWRYIHAVFSVQAYVKMKGICDWYYSGGYAYLSGDGISTVIITTYGNVWDATAGKWLITNRAGYRVDRSVTVFNQMYDCNAWVDGVVGGTWYDLDLSTQIPSGHYIVQLVYVNIYTASSSWGGGSDNTAVDTYSSNYGTFINFVSWQ